MALSRWSLHQLVMWLGTAALMVLFIPMAIYLTHNASSAAERSLSERGRGLARTLAGQIVEPMLLEDQLGVHSALHKAGSADDKVRYLCVESVEGDIVAHTFEAGSAAAGESASGGGYPVALVALWRDRPESMVRFRTKDELLMDVSAPIMEGQLGTLHVGMSRAGAAEATARVLRLIGTAFVGAVVIILIGSRLVAARVSRPLRQLEDEVSRLPHEGLATPVPHVSGTREVASLAVGFAGMAARLDALEKERAVTQERMVHAERLAALGELAAGLAHEINNPLDGMQECVRYLGENPTERERIAKYLPMLREGLGRIADVMQHMLTFARLGQEISLEACPTADIVDSLALMLKGRLDAQKIRLTWRPPGGCVCYCNRHGLLQAMLNLVLNAADAAKGSPAPEVLIDAKCDDRWAYLAVEDSGPGVPDELRERIFEAFFTTRSPGEGTGLGLSISRQLVRAVGGELELSPRASRLGGARFVIRVPLARRAECATECADA